MSIDPTRFVYIPGASEIADIDLDETKVHNAVTGKRITESMLDAEALELERQYPGLVPGGKSLNGDGTHSPALRVVVSQSTAEAVKARAKSEHISVSKYLRNMIERAVSD